jgi:hypothetical protein
MNYTRLVLLAGLLVSSAQAHDPYEITSVVYVRTNQIELFMEMEFPTGMKLAGVNPSREVAAASQFAAAQTQLRDLAGSFFIFTAGNNGVLPLRTNIELGVEDHIRLQVDFAPTPYRPLQFTARGLRGFLEDAYGTSLTVLDMVNQKVLGQTTLFADSSAVEFPPRALEAVAAPQPENVAEKIPVSVVPTAPTNLLTALDSEPPGKSEPSSQSLVWILAMIGLGVIALVVFGISKARVKSR